MRRIRELWPYTQGTRALFDVAHAMDVVHRTVEESKRKQTFGRPLIKWQVIQFRLLDSQMKLELVEPMALHHAWLLDSGRTAQNPDLSHEAYASLLHHQVSAFTKKAFEDCVEIGSGRVFNTDHPVWQRYMQHLDLLRSDGGSEVDHAVIAGALWPSTSAVPA